MQSSVTYGPIVLKKSLKLSALSEMQNNVLNARAGRRIFGTSGRFLMSYVVPEGRKDLQQLISWSEWIVKENRLASSKSASSLWARPQLDDFLQRNNLRLSR